ncbi:LacI family DNA-binding transcriptional regulator [Microvirga alba]|uniref:LacI family DNA-binding transcriptional regulator n=1 Tax=Microvirga alba TaxID=2791025 RepID=A0A931FPI4_9HYPH|nr:LacI family DNA-binding transcriptional regulator [Microvirga alba]MBF9232448.1 LacI family DNA-binding transcriptional regulator [Microvirga alba]
MDHKPAMPTLHDIARAAGVSVASVSKVLNNRPGVSEESRRRVLDIAGELGYLGRAGRASRSAVNSVTIVTLSRYFSDSQFYEEIFQGIMEEADARSLDTDVRLLPSDGPGAEVDVSDIFRNGLPGSILLLGLDQPAIVEQVVASGVPAVIINGLDPTMRLSSISPDNRFAGWLATQRLLEVGHREIVYITLPLRLSLRRRLDGFRDAMESVGITFDPDRHVIDLDKEKVADFETRIAIDRAFKSGRLKETTAFLCSTDIIALGVLQSLEARGLSVPSDYSVIGFDDMTIALHSRPPLTTMRIDRVELGRQGIAMLMEQIANPNTSPRRVAMAVPLIERATVGPPRTQPA